jgi:hypothetical protein
MVADGRMPKPKRINSRVLWDRHELDIAFEKLSDLMIPARHFICTVFPEAVGPITTDFLSAPRIPASRANTPSRRA